MKIAHISDTHFPQIIKESFDRSIEKINNSDIEFVIHTGDLVDRGYLREYEEAIQSFSKLKKPIIFVPGNHDGKNVGLKLFENFIGPLNGVKEPNTGRERNVLFNSGDVLDLLLKYGVNLVLNGHKHYPNVYKLEDLVIVNAGTMCSIKTRLGDKNSFNIIEIDDKIKVKTLRFGEIREREYERKKERIYNVNSEKLFRIVQIAGTCIDNSDIFNKKMFLNAFKKISTLNPDFIVHCGDIVNEGLNKNYTLAAKYLKTPIFFVPGPRDINYLGYNLFPKYFDFIETHVTKKVAFKFLNSCQYDSDIGVIGRGELDRIKQFSRIPSEFKAIVLHHNLLPIENTREKGLLEDAGDILYELTRLKIDLVLTGHSSHPSARKIENTLYKDFIYVSEIQSLSGSRHVLGIWKRKI